MSTNNASRTIKVSLLEACKTYVDQRIANALQAIASASDAAADDTKSSAGDKFETTREMMQQELNRHQQLLTDAKRMEKVLADLDVRIHTEPAKLGSLVKTNHGMFFIAVSVGQLQIDGTTYRAISPASPLGQRFIGAKIGEGIDFNGMNYQIISVC
ncbi:3-oxoacyl-ACP synthase [Parapedobacter deserti]|uniref:3-oxoacyl-ACP synthase n=1 Tax=Parapedobacter deserti TaxID=1912957 RepID=A0ABV7JMV6_9SPHI